MKHKIFKGKLTDTTLTNGYYGDEGVCIQIFEADEPQSGSTHIFNNKKEVRRFIKQLKKSLDE